MLIELRQRGDFKNTEKFLKNAKEMQIRDILDSYGRMGVEALSSATPRDTGKTAESWTYSIEIGSESCSVIWSNTNVNKGVNIAVILQYGHGTGTGGWVEGRDYINPALQPIFDKLADDAWEKIVQR